jgi:uncharacterized tellurite resistance protein B-like protein
MPVLGLILAVVGAVLFWWWRMQRVRDAAETVIDVAGKAKGAVNRARFRNKAGQSVLAGVEDPGVAAATLLYSLMAQKRAVSLSDEDKMDSLLESVCRMNARDRQEAMAFAAWASAHVADTNEVVRRFLPLWERTLEPAQHRELVDMALAISEVGSAPTDGQSAAIRRLSEGLLTP